MALVFLLPRYNQCMKHAPTFRNRVQWLLNKLQNSLIPHQYVNRVFSLLCKCPKDQSIRIEDPWENVLPRHLIDAVTFIDSYVSHNTDNAQASILKELMIYLRRQHVIPYEDQIPRIDMVTEAENINKSSSLRLLYILQKAIEKNFTILEPPRTDEQEEQRRREQMSLSFDLEGFNHEYLGNLIGGAGENILKFMRKFKCYVQFDKVPDGDSFKVQATIKKRAAVEEVLERIKQELIKYAKECHEMELAYEELRQEKMAERKTSFTELLRKTDGMGPNADWNTILEKIEKNPVYLDVADHVDFNMRKQWFQEIKENWSQIIQSDPDATEVNSVIVGEQQVSSGDQPLSIEETTPKLVPTFQNNLQAGAVTNSNFVPTDQQKSNGTATSQSAIAVSSSQFSQLASNSSGISQSAAGCSDIGLSNPDSSQDSMQMAICTSACLVHDRRWVPTFQYLLTQCYTLIHMPRKYGYPFSKHVCTCDQPEPVPHMYFPITSEMKLTFQQVRTTLHCWPEEQRTIVQPLINQLDKYDHADTWFSLMKFVYYFTAMKQSKYDKLDPGASLPGARAQPSSPQSSAIQPSAGAQSPVQPRPEIVSSLGGASLGTARSLGISSLLQGESQGGGASAATPPSPGAASGTATGQRPARLKKLSSADWIDDCFFHGQKKKFVFQCIINYLHRYARLPVKLNIPFSLAVCCCNETIEFKDFFSSENACVDNCKFMKEKLEVWRGDSKASIKPYITLLDDYINNRNITPGFLKFVYHFRKAYVGDNVEFTQLKDELKRQR